MAAEGKVIGKSGLLHEGPNENQQSTTKLVEKSCHKRALLKFCRLQTRKRQSPNPSMQCCAPVRATCNKQQTP